MVLLENRSRFHQIILLLKVNGKRAYELARGGIEFELKSRKIVVYFINSVVVNEENNECSFTIKCSKELI